MNEQGLGDELIEPCSGFLRWFGGEDDLGAVENADRKPSWGPGTEE